jgi:hypothetical protein
MRHWNSRKALLLLTAILLMVLPLALVSCGGDDDDDETELTAQDLAGKSFTFPASFIITDANPPATGTATLTFGDASTINGNTIPFILTFSDVPGTVLNGTATISTIELAITEILVNGVLTNSVSLFGVTVSVGQVFSFETSIQRNPDGSVVITFINVDGVEITFEFEEGQTGSTGTGGTGTGD